MAEDWREQVPRSWNANPLRLGASHQSHRRTSVPWECITRLLRSFSAGFSPCVVTGTCVHIPPSALRTSVPLAKAPANILARQSLASLASPTGETSSRLGPPGSERQLKFSSFAQLVVTHRKPSLLVPPDPWKRLSIEGENSWGWVNALGAALVAARSRNKGFFPAGFI